MEPHYSVFTTCCHSCLQGRQNSSLRDNLRNQLASLGRDRLRLSASREESKDESATGQNLYFTMKCVKTLQDTNLGTVEMIKELLCNPNQNHTSKVICPGNKEV